ELNWNALANNNGTLVFLMGIGNLKKISDNLIKHGKSKYTKVALISWATRPNQRVVVSDLENVYEKAISENVKPPTLIVVGSVVGLREKLNFFEQKPLFGKNVMVTRTRLQNSSLVEKIMDLGGNPIEIPTIKIEKVENNIQLENEIKDIKNYTYLVLTSKNAVDIFFDKLKELHMDCRILANTKVCAIGLATAKAISQRGINPDIVPEKFVAEDLYEELKHTLKRKDRVLIPRAKNARNYLVDKLKEICYVTEVDTYETVIDKYYKDEILELIQDENIDYMTFASSSAVKNFIEIIGEGNKEKLKKIKIIS
ncbi:MAG: uroporphyrinogen-III synthase, partial [Peptostreptococcaceae bacterium]